MKKEVRDAITVLLHEIGYFEEEEKREEGAVYRIQSQTSGDVERDIRQLIRADPIASLANLAKTLIRDPEWIVTVMRWDKKLHPAILVYLRDNKICLHNAVVLADVPLRWQPQLVSPALELPPSDFFLFVKARMET